MKLSRRERQMLVGGAIIAGLVILVNWIIVPLGGKWAALGKQLAPKLTLLEALRSRAEPHSALLARRARLARQVGSLLGPERSEDSEKKPTGKPPEPSTASAKPPEAAQTAKPRPRSLEVELEKIGKKTGVKISVGSTGKAPRQAVPLKHFKMIVKHIDAGSNIESLMKMLHNLEKGERFIRVNRLEIHQDLKKPGALSVKMHIVAYAPADEA